MKPVSLVLLCIFTALSIQAQQSPGAVTFSVDGNKNLQLSVDGREYSLSGSNISGNKTTQTYNTIEAGQHNFQVVRLNQNTNRTERISSLFNLRPGFDLLVHVNLNGSIELIETRKKGAAEYQVPMSAVNFNRLLTNVRNQRSVTAKSSVISTAFSTSTNYFTTSQVRQLLQQVTSEGFRIELAKKSYPLITDPGNFYQLYSLVNSEAGRNELADYVNNYEGGTPSNNAMSETDFSDLYQTIRQQRPVSAQVNSLASAFGNTSNYFTADQASQLIQLVSIESSRLQLAKLSYRSITDPDNFSLVASLLYNQSSRDELEAYVRNYNAGNSPGVAMSDANFNTLYQTIRQQRPVSTQVNSLASAFNNTSNYFTSNQASQLIQLVSAESSRLQLAKLSYRSITDRVNFRLVSNLLNTQASRDELAAYVSNYNGNTTAGTAMSDANFNALYQTIRQQWPVSTQMNSLTSAFNNTSNYFTSNQASQLIQLVSAENNRLQLAKLSYRSITDRNNFNQVSGLLYNQASRDELAAYISNINAGTPSGAPMADADFSALYQNIQMQFFPNERMNSLTSVFNNTSYYFTCAQVKQLIQLVSFESNRLQLAKLSYRTITDRNNFTQVYEILNSQASRDELDAYVKAYRG